MDRGLRAPLSPNEEIALRRVAYGSFDIATPHLQRLFRLALIEPNGSGVRLTAAGAQRVRSLGGPIVDEKRPAPMTIWLPLAKPAAAPKPVVPSTLPLFWGWPAVPPAK